MTRAAALLVLVAGYSSGCDRLLSFSHSIVDGRATDRPAGEGLVSVERALSDRSSLDQRTGDGPRSDQRRDLHAADAAPAPVIYAHTTTTLYTFDPATKATPKVAAFKWPDGADSMNDIAIDRYGNMFAISPTTLYKVAAASGSCSVVGTPAVGSELIALSFINNPVGTEALWTVTSDGSVYKLDTSNASPTYVGDLGAPPSGDLVSTKLGTFAVVTGLEATDAIVSVDSSGKGTQVGTKGTATGYTYVLGLVASGGFLYGFTQGGETLKINPTTGTASLYISGGPAWLGAGVSTAAP